MKSILWKNTNAPFPLFLHKKKMTLSHACPPTEGRGKPSLNSSYRQNVKLRFSNWYMELIFPIREHTEWTESFYELTSSHFHKEYSCYRLHLTCGLQHDRRSYSRWHFWSPDKAMMRRQELMSEQSTKRAEYNKLNRTTSDYSGTRDNLLKKLHEIQSTPSSLKDKASTDAARKAIEEELGNM